MQDLTLLRLTDGGSHGPSLGEHVLAILVVGIVLAAGVRSGGDALQQTTWIEALFLHSGPRVELMEYRALFGGWPTDSAALSSLDRLRWNETEQREENLGRYLRDARYDGAGQVSYRALGPFPEAGQLLSIRAAVAPATGAITWLCGHAAATPGFELANEQNQTSATQLPSPCRAPVSHESE